MLPKKYNIVLFSENPDEMFHFLGKKYLFSYNTSQHRTYMYKRNIQKWDVNICLASKAHVTKIQDKCGDQCTAV